MIDPDEALARLLALATPVDVETLPLIEAAGRWTAQPILARRTQPSCDLSAMDGYAIRTSDMTGRWRVVGESAAGHPWPGSIGPNEAVRIFTGAAMPKGADTVIIQENITRHDDTIERCDATSHSRGANVRVAGSDFVVDQSLIADGERVTPARIALAAIAGHAALVVRRRIRVAIISTGDELIPVGAALGDERIPASNALMLVAMLGELPVSVTDLGIVPDDRHALTAIFAKAAGHDIIVSTGGASVGDHDLVRQALIDAGAAIDFWKIAIRPGKPLMAGRLGDAIVLGLPGNPVSAFVTAFLFLKPLIAHLSGATNPEPVRMQARLATDLPAVGERTDYVRGCWQDGTIAPLPGNSGMLVPLAAATAFIVRPASAPRAARGDNVEIISLA